MIGRACAFRLRGLSGGDERQNFIVGWRLAKMQERMKDKDVQGAHHGDFPYLEQSRDKLSGPAWQRRQGSTVGATCFPR